MWSQTQLEKLFGQITEPQQLWDMAQTRTSDYALGLVMWLEFKGAHYVGLAARCIEHGQLTLDQFSKPPYPSNPEAVIVRMAAAHPANDETEASMAQLQNQLQQLSNQTLRTLLPLVISPFRAVVLRVLGWEKIIPFIESLEQIATIPFAGSSDIPNSPDPNCGVLPVVHIQQMIADINPEALRTCLELLTVKNSSVQNTALLFSALLGDKRSEIERKFKKDAQIGVKAYGLLPLLPEETVLSRYLDLKQSAKRGLRFGQQRRASHAAAVKVALANLAQLTGYTDAQALEWAMEAELAGEMAADGREWQVGDYTLHLTVAGAEADIDVLRAGKPLKSVPKHVRASAEYQAAREAVTQLRAQATRLRSEVIEPALMSGTWLSIDELKQLLKLPAGRSILEALIFRTPDEHYGILEVEDMRLRDWDNTSYPIRASVGLAHPYHLYQQGTLANWQKALVHQRLTQPLKQAFRELYLLTPAERETNTYSNRFAGHVIEARIAERLFISRGWRLGHEEAPHKRFGEYHVVFEFAEHWYYPGANIALTTDRIVFQHATEHTKHLPLETIPPLIFSEVMRDADLVVSVAQRDGEQAISPEIFNQRAAIVSALLDDLGLSGVTVEGHFAHVEGKLAKYRVHLGSAVIYIEPGNYLCIVPAKWGQKHEKLFLPFADQGDHKLSEVVSKILLLVADDKIKDETILRQIQR